MQVECVESGDAITVTETKEETPKLEEEEEERKKKGAQSQGAGEHSFIRRNIQVLPLV